MSNKLLKFSTFSLLLASACASYAATPVDLNRQSLSVLSKLAPLNKPTLAAAASATQSDFTEVSQSTDFNQTLHTRLKQTYAGYPVWGGDAVVHTPKGRSKTLRGLMASSEANQSTMSGQVYEGLAADLQNTPAYVFSAAQADKAISTALADFENKVGARAEVQFKAEELMVYVDSNNKARFAFKVTTAVKANGKLAQPTYLLNATDLSVYEAWDNRKTATLDAVKGGGVGGNGREGKYTYDGAQGNLAGFDLLRDAQNKLCYLQNDMIKVSDARISRDETATYRCDAIDSEHNQTYFSKGDDAINGGYSPNNDAMFAAKIINDMYQSWYRIPVLTKDSKPMQLVMITHDPNEGENAEWDDITERMMFGDGGDMFYPLTSLGVTAHEISHGFTSQHSNLIYKNESGGMNEAFSDMADQAALFYSGIKPDFMIGSEIAKEDNFALRYMEKPSKDCEFYGKGNQCSIDSAAAYKRNLNVHFSSGVYNRAFYLLATTNGWNVKKAFDVMVQANRNYWTENSTFVQGACGVLSAAKDYQYDTQSVVEAFKQVGIDTSKC